MGAFLWTQFRYYENEILLDECLSKCEAIERKFLKEGEEIKKGKRKEVATNRKV